MIIGRDEVAFISSLSLSLSLYEEEIVKIIFVQNARMIYNGPSPACLLTTMMMMMIILYLSLLEKFQPLQSHPPPSGTKKGPTTREKEEFPCLLKSEALRGDFDSKSQAERGFTLPAILPM